jgi:hypothetical protein
VVATLASVVIVVSAAAKLAFHSSALAAKSSERYWPQMSSVKAA